MDLFIVTETGCHEWTGSRFNSGYARVKIGGKSYRLHRLVWQLAHGTLDPGVLVLHRCDNPPCVRLDHLFTGTHVDNMADMVTKGRASKNLTRRYTHGDLHHNAKLTDAQVAEVRARYDAGGTSQTALAKEYGVSQGLVSQIIRGASRRATATSGRPLSGHLLG